MSTSTSLPKQPAIDGDEQDLVSNWPAAYLTRAGVKSAIKRRMRRRQRRTATDHIKEWM